MEGLEARELLAALPLLPLAGSPPAQVAPPPTGAPSIASAQFEPLTGRILVEFTADPAGYNPAVLTNPANYDFTLDQAFEKQPTRSQSRPKVDIVLPPPYAVTGVTLANPIEPDSATSVIVSINNNEPLRFGIYRFTVRSAGLVDLDGRALDGQYAGTFPTGDGPAGDFVANLSEVNSTVLPAIPASMTPSQPDRPGVPPSQVFLPTTRGVRVRYTSATSGQFMLAGGNKITLHALAFQHFPGTYRLPALDASMIPGTRLNGT